MQPSRIMSIIFKRMLIVAPWVLTSYAFAIPFELAPVGPLRTEGFHIAQDINEQGQVAGVANQSDGTSDAFIWDSASDTFLPLGPVPSGFDNRGGNAAPVSINDSSQIAGLLSPAVMGLFTTAFIWDNSVTTPLGTLPNRDSSVAFDINNAGVVVGETGKDGIAEPFLWNGSVNLLPLLPGMSRGSALAINNVGQAVGFQQNLRQSQQIAVLWENGIVRNLSRPNEDGSTALAINDKGVVAGVSDTGIKRTFFLWDNGVRTDVFSGRGGSFFDMNNGGAAVGTFVDSDFQQYAFLWSNMTGLLNLNDLIDPNSGWVLREASGINELGQIVGLATNPFGISQGFLLSRTSEALPTSFTSVPEPGTLGLLGMGLLGLGFTERRRA